jgi:indolepyruvate ferredoxin oxidoreductase beta subunit
MTDVVIAGVGGQGTVLASKLLAQAALLEGRAIRTAETIGMAQRGGTVLGHVRIGPAFAHIGNDSSSSSGNSSDNTHTGNSAAASDSTDGNDSGPHGTNVSAVSAPLSPLVPPGSADVLIGFEPGEAVRALGYLRANGTVIAAQQALKPVTATLSATPYDGRTQCAYLCECEKSGRIGILSVVDGAAICAELGSNRILNVVLLGAALASKSLDLSASALLEAIEILIKPPYQTLNRAALAKGMKAAT